MKLLKKKRKTIGNNFLKENFKYSSPSNIYKKLSTATDIEENKIKVNKIKNNSANLLMKIKNNPTNNTKKKKLETEITWWKLSNSLVSLINQNNKEVA